ncbi:MAG: NAD(P)-dependent oxidoreductase [Gammaproteobacteria bacterium]|nr:NAD(P)-dependent oxidoreductase [Gammaproteobacteria bacterium]
MTPIGFIGTGTIGSPMAARLIGGGQVLRVYDLQSDATRALEDQGAQRAASGREIAETCAVIFLSLPGPKQIEEVMLGAEGLLAHALPATTIVDLSTNALALNRQLAAAAQARGLHYLDAPVSGGKVGAVAGKLAVMVGGELAAFEAIRPLLACFGENIFYLGAAGAGTLSKLINNQIFLCASVLIQEGFVMGAKAGMDPNTVLEVLKVSSAGSLMARASLVLSRKFDLDVFSLAIAAKDVEVALASGLAVGAHMPLTAAASGVYQQALAAGLGAQDFFATVKVLETAAGVTLPPLRKPPTPSA